MVWKATEVDRLLLISLGVSDRKTSLMYQAHSTHRYGGAMLSVTGPSIKTGAGCSVAASACLLMIGAG